MRVAPQHSGGVHLVGGRHTRAVSSVHAVSSIGTVAAVGALQALQPLLLRTLVPVGHGYLVRTLPGYRHPAATATAVLSFRMAVSAHHTPRHIYLHRPPPLPVGHRLVGHYVGQTAAQRAAPQARMVPARYSHAVLQRQPSPAFLAVPSALQHGFRPLCPHLYLERHGDSFVALAAAAHFHPQLHIVAFCVSYCFHRSLRLF
ncbi:MAG: hypothetical protein IKQ20_03985 [Bacteroidales bacterium]|nr:hypothetical protein [Bacteroidales bacterium]